ncbi:MAG: glutamate-5-semialdehyde dehydrogenase [Gammaproteobacteria bacterium]
MNIQNLVIEQAQKAKQGARRLAHLPTSVKNQLLLEMAGLLKTHETEILKANAQDMQEGRKQGLSVALLDRLALTTTRLKGMADALMVIAELPDPVGRELAQIHLDNGLLINKVSVPLGVIGFIYEARPNVTTDAIGLALKSGNGIVLKGGKEAINSNRAIVNSVLPAFATLKIDPLISEAVQFIDSTERSATHTLLAQTDSIDLIIPRGGKTLIQAVMEYSRIPVLQHLDGICHIFVDESAKLDMAEKIIINAKCQRPGVCNAVETLLVHAHIAPAFLPVIAQALHAQKVELRGCKRTQALIKDVPILSATEEDWSTEYSDYILSIRVVDSLEEAIEHINHYGSHHSDSIITENQNSATEFLQYVDSAVVYHNASTRFTDGGIFGFGAEIGISTGKLHARGPVGLNELTTYQYRALGNGQVHN